MKKNMHLDSKEAKERKQKESHSEIERKRRERMKKETEYLNIQLPEADRKDKLSVFQAGCDQLISYTDSLNKRDYIITDSEYSTIITNNFSGFDLHIRCCDGKILHIHENIQQVLGQSAIDLMGCSIFDMSEPSEHTVQLLYDTLNLSNLERKSAQDGELISRELTIPIRVTDASLHALCIPSFDNCWYRFIEVCGEITNEDDDPGGMESNNGTNFVLKALCRPCEASVSYGGWCQESQMHITTKHRPDTMQISEVTGQVRDLLGIDPKLLIGKELSDFVPYEEKSYVRKNFQDVLKSGSILFICPMQHQSGRTIRFRIQLTVIDIKGKVQFIIAKSEVANPETDLPAYNGCHDAMSISQSDFETTSAINGISKISPDELITNFPVSRGLVLHEAESPSLSAATVCQPCSSNEVSSSSDPSLTNQQLSHNLIDQDLIYNNDLFPQNDSIMDLLNDFPNDITIDFDLQNILKEELDRMDDIPPP